MKLDLGCSVFLAFMLGGVRGLATKANGSTTGVGFGASKEPTLNHTPDNSESTQRLIQFLKSQNAKGVEQGVADIGFGDDGRRGLFARTKIKKDQIICMVPSDCALALSDPALKGDDAPTFAHGGLNFLKMYKENDQARKIWAPYLDTLPARESNFDPTPDFYSDEEIQLLEFPRLINNIRKRKKDIQNLATENSVDFDELQLATWLVSSRAFNVQIAEDDNDEAAPRYDDRGQIIIKAGVGTKSIRVLVPFLDMANHDSVSPNCRFTIIDPEKDDAWFALEATRNIPAGKELRITYRGGIYSSVELLLNYGFVDNQSKVDRIMLRKGGDDCIQDLADWTTTLEEDLKMLEMVKEDKNNPLNKILAFRAKMKEAYKD